MFPPMSLRVAFRWRTFPLIRRADVDPSTLASRSLIEQPKADGIRAELRSAKVTLPHVKSGTHSDVRIRVPCKHVTQDERSKTRDVRRWVSDSSKRIRLARETWISCRVTTTTTTAAENGVNSTHGAVKDWNIHGTEMERRKDRRQHSDVTCSGRGVASGVEMRSESRNAMGRTRELSRCGN